MYLTKTQIKQQCKEFLHDFDGLLSFGWDSGFNALLAEFPTRKQHEVRQVLEPHLQQIWDSKSIRTAPLALKETAGDLGDLRNNQLLFTSEPAAEQLVFAAWWPWGNGERVSLRIAATAAENTPVEATGIVARLKGFFA
jgi:hypothetical protein